jgi:hypothetical protein
VLAVLEFDGLAGCPDSELFRDPCEITHETSCHRLSAMASAALRKMGMHSAADEHEKGTSEVVFDFNEIEPPDIELHCAEGRNDLRRGEKERWDILYCAYCARFHEWRNGFSEAQRDVDVEERHCTAWANQGMRSKFLREHGGTTRYPEMELHGTGGLLSIAKDKRWAFKVTNVPGVPPARILLPICAYSRVVCTFRCRVEWQ